MLSSNTFCDNRNLPVLPAVVLVMIDIVVTLSVFFETPVTADGCVAALVVDRVLLPLVVCFAVAWEVVAICTVGDTEVLVLFVICAVVVLLIAEGDVMLSSTCVIVDNSAVVWVEFV